MRHLGAYLQRSRHFKKFLGPDIRKHVAFLSYSTCTEQQLLVFGVFFPIHALRYDLRRMHGWPLLADPCDLAPDGRLR